ncbi:MAG: putative Ig domain-containing protein [Sulfurimonas sp.]|jgi:hypothetical protein
MKLDIKKIFLAAVVLFLINSGLFAHDSHSPNVTISPTSQNITLGTASVTLQVTLTPAPNKNSITVHYSDSCNNSNGTITVAKDSSSGSITIATSALVSGTTCNVTLTSAIGADSPKQADGHITTSTAEIVVPSSNLPPIANAGADQTVTVGTNVTLNGSGSSDSDGSISSYTWKDGATLLSSDANFSKSDFSEGTHTITLTVTDNSGNSNSDSLTLIVSSSDTPPVMGNIPDQSAVNGTPFALNISDYVTLTNSDPITSYTLNGSLPSGLSFSTSTGAFSGTPTADGTYNFTVYATDKDGNSNSASFTITVTSSIGAPSFQNTSECGLFSSVLTSYTHIYSNGNNDQACYTNNISYPAGELTGSITCNPTACDGGVACQRQDPPINRLNPTFPTNSKSDSPNGSDPTTLTDLEYGNLTYNNTTVNFNPTSTYSNNISKVMLLSNVTISKSTLNFEPGDYYFDSLTIDGNNNNVILPSGGPVRIFIKNNFLIDMNNLSYNTAAGSSENNLFTYIGGNFESLGNGGGTTSWKAFMYVKGSTTLTNNSNNWSINGGITSEGPIEINGNNPDFIQSGDASNLGYGACSGTSTPILGIFDAWEISMADRNITTKIVNKPFTLTIASLDSARTALQTKTGITVKYQLYDYNTNGSVTGYESFDASISSTISKTYTVNPTAYKDVRVRFKYCKDANSSIKPYSNCEYPVVSGCSFENNVASTDNFAIRPDSFILTSPSADNINLLTSAQEYSFPVTAIDFNTTTAVSSYTIVAANSVLSLVRTMYQPSNTVDDNLSGTLSFSTTPFNITNGVANALIKFDDVGKVNIQLRDTTWAAVDGDDTSGDCNATGRYVCGDINATFIPDHFTLSAVHLNNNSAQTFTYLSDDLNMSAHLDVNVSAKNLSNAVTQNFKSGSWENPVDVNMSVVSAASTPTIIKDDINETQNLGFTLGAIAIPWNETNATKKLMFNFNRDVNDSKNPFMINGSEVTLGAKSTYTDSGTTKIVTGSSVADQNATFIYGRTHAPRYRFSTDTGEAFIYYESFCHGTDSSGTTCNKALLPNANSSLSTDDPRWFINTNHTSVSGAAAGVSQKNGTNIVTATIASSANPALTTLNYTASATKGYPYKTTMENNASSWLIYNKYNAASTKNEFEVEFEGSGSSWTGKHETNTTTNKSGTDKTNRRTMW